MILSLNYQITYGSIISFQKFLHQPQNRLSFAFNKVIHPLCFPLCHSDGAMPDTYTLGDTEPERFADMPGDEFVQKNDILILYQTVHHHQLDFRPVLELIYQNMVMGCEEAVAFYVLHHVFEDRVSDCQAIES